MDSKNMTSVQNKRMPYLDICKAIAMISVVMFHACTNNGSTYKATNAYLIRITSAYAMPLFFFINGFLYKNKNVDKPIHTLLKRIKAYFLPFLYYNLAYLFLHNVFVYLHMVDDTYGNGYYDAKEFARHFILAITGHREFFSGAMWFLGSILTIQAIIIAAEYIIHKMLHDKYKYTILGIITVLCLVAGQSGYVTNTMRIASSLSSMYYFFFGMLFRKFDWNKVFLKRKYVYIIVAIIADLVISYQKLYDPFQIYHGFTGFLLDSVNAFLCIIAIMLISQFEWIANNRVLLIVGKNTLDIMALHFMVFKMISYIMILVYSLPIERLAEYPVLKGIGGGWWILYTIVGVTIPTLFSIGRHKLFKKGWTQTLLKRSKHGEHIE